MISPARSIPRKNLAAFILVLVAAFFLNLATAPPALAVPPPDFIFSIANNFGIILSFTAAFLASLIASMRSHFGLLVHTTRGRLILAGIILISFGAVTLAIKTYGTWQQNRSYAAWLKQSAAAKQAELAAESAEATPISTPIPTTAATPEPAATVAAALPSPSSTDLPTPASTSFFDSNKDLPRLISNADFSQVLKSGTPYVLDAREDEENRYGHFPGSTHIRSADITAGAWKQLPQDQVIYVLCWSGIRGKEVADFLVTQRVVARYLVKGADGWVTYGGTWDGGIKFDQIHPEERYHIVLETSQVEDAMKNGAFIVDSRPVKTYGRYHIPGSVNLPIIYTPTAQLQGAFAQIPIGSTIITVCDDFVSCFDARLTGLKAEQDRQAIFMGRYATPWDYRGKHS